MQPAVPSRLQRIAVFRALVLGDLLCATPALRALRRAHPEAQITLVGLPWAQALAARLPVDRFLPFPGWPGLPESRPSLDALPGFLAQMQAQRFDLALQLHGSGRLTNPLVAAFGARRTAGFFQPGDWCPDEALCRPWPGAGHEIERCLALTDHLGCPRDGVHLDFPVRDEDHERLRSTWPAVDDDAPFVVLHPGSQLRSRRWPVERFARVAQALLQRGWRVAVSGSAGEAPLAAALNLACGGRLVDLSGRTDLWMLGALLQRTCLLVGNDTGLSHIAAALGTPSVIVSLGSDVARWAPLDRTRHRVLWHDVPCRPCGHAVCPGPHDCATGVATGAVIDAVLDSLPTSHDRPSWPRPRAACAS